MNGSMAHLKRLTAASLLGAVLSTIVFTAAATAGFERGITLEVDGFEYYLAGPPDAPGGARDIPGHFWVNAGKIQVVGKHYNTGPFGAPSWWSSDAPDGALLFMVHGFIDDWTLEKAESYASRGYVHYHELVDVMDGLLHPTKVVWLRHTALKFFTLDGGPRPDLAHEVRPGVDHEFINNYFVPYSYEP